MGNGWKGGSCRALASHGEHLFAATFHAGVVAIDSAEKDPAWRVPDINCGLPLRDPDRLLHKVNDVTVAPLLAAETGPMPTVICGGPHGAFRSHDGVNAFRNVSTRTFNDHVTIGEGFLFCSGTHKVEAVHDETR